MRHYSLTLSRPGLKPGYYVPFRLRIVDTATVLSGIPTGLAAIGVGMFSPRWAQQLGLGIVGRNQWACFGCMILVLFVTAWILYFWSIGLLRLLFL